MDRLVVQYKPNAKADMKQLTIDEVMDEILLCLDLIDDDLFSILNKAKDGLTINSSNRARLYVRDAQMFVQKVKEVCEIEGNGSNKN